MARFSFNSRRYEMLMSTLLVYATRRIANCVALAILISPYQLVKDIRAHGGNASIFAALHSRAPGHRSTTGTECHTVSVGLRLVREPSCNWPCVKDNCGLSIYRLMADEWKISIRSLCSFLLSLRLTS